MNKRQFSLWLQSQGCDVSPRDGVNNTAPPLVITNRKTGRYSYLAVPIHDDFIPKKAVEKVAKDLGIELPPGF